MTKKNEFQWEHTPIFLDELTIIAQEEKETIGDFLQKKCLATEKFDGTNISKDDEGIIYSKRIVIGSNEKQFHGTSLEEIRKINIQEMKVNLAKDLGVSSNEVGKLVVFGELIIKNPYSYDKRGHSGKWFIFGAKLECGDNICQIKEKLIEQGYSIENLDEEFKKLKILPCQKLFDLANQIKLDTVPVISRDKNVGDVIESLKDRMKKGEIEGIILTLKDNDGYKICKWKGPQEYQPSIHKRFLEANDSIIQPDSLVSERVKFIFNIVAEVILDTSQNQAMHKKGDKKGKQGEKVRVLTNEHKAIIQVGITKTLKKFNMLEVYQEQGTLENVGKEMNEEVKRHLLNETQEFQEIQDDDPVMKYIANMMKGRIQKEIKSKSSN